MLQDNSTTQETRYISVAESAKYIRQALKENFPGIKFSVKSHNYAGGGHVNVHWTDGPTSDAVDRVCSAFEGSSFDGMIDLKSYYDTELNGEKVHFGNDGTSTNRSHSVEFVTAIARAYCERYHCPMPMIALSGKDAYIADRNYSDRGDYREQIVEKIYHTDASKLDNIFEEEDAREAEYQAWCAEQEAAKVAQQDTPETHQDEP